MNSNLRNAATIARDIAEEEAADAYEALSDEVQELREEIAILRSAVEAQGRRLAVIERGILQELRRLLEEL